MSFPSRASLFPVGALLPASFKTLLAQWFDAEVNQEDPVSRYGAIQNLSLSLSVAASALTIAIKTRAGSDPSSTAPAVVPFRNPTAASGDFTASTITAANSLVVSSGSTLGTSNSTPFRLWVVLFNDAGTLRLGVINCLSGTNIYPLKDDAIPNSAAEGGAGAADSAHVFYTGTSVTSKAMRILGYAEWSAGLATAGTWSSAPTKVQLFGPGIPLPGQSVQVQRNQTGASTTGTTALPTDNTIPQSTEGDQFLSQAITPTSAPNVLRIASQVNGFGTGANNITAALFQDAAANALAATVVFQGTSAGDVVVPLTYEMRAGTTSSSTFKVRAGLNVAGTFTFNPRFNGVQASHLTIEEVMA